MKKRFNQDPNLAKKRNFAKYRLAGMHSSLRTMCRGKHYFKAPLLKEERIALNSILKDITAILHSWDENYKKLKRYNNEGKT